MKRALALVVIPLVSWACGGETPPPATAADAPAADAPAADAPAADAPAAAADGEPAGADEAWSGEEAAKSERVPPGKEGVTETRTMEVIAKVVKDNRQPVRDCMDKAKKELPDLKGDMVIHFVVDPEGKVKKAELNQERSTLKAPAVVECAIKTIKGINFPPSSRGMDTTVNYPYNLN
ncbi:MAG TPA: AgmX/PglI C-terminal domain-containing protein [Polyangiaceae bacterium]|nr:AgmX/PglI C-terminal domain-containing protein [Polyangiaceae bacterium]